VQPTTNTATPPLTRACAAVADAAEGSMIRRTFSARFSGRAAAFSTICLGGGGRSDPSQPQRGADLRYDMEISFEEAANGCEKEITVNNPTVAMSARARAPRAAPKPSPARLAAGAGRSSVRAAFSASPQTCPRCEGAGRVIEKPCKACQGTGRREHSSQNQTADSRRGGHGNRGSGLRETARAGFRGGPPGDLYIVLHVKPHEIFQRDGEDLICEVPVSFVQAALGAEIEVPTLSGKTHIKIPAGTQPGTVFRLKGRGVKNIEGYGSGDLHIRVIVEVPGHLNHAQKAKLQEFAELCDETVNPITQSFFEKAKKLFS